MVSTGEGASAVIPCLSFPAERLRRRSHHLRRDHQVEHGVRDTLEFDLTRKPDLLQVVLAGCTEAAAAARASERPAICPWVETAQRPTPTRKSGNTQLHEAPSCFEAEGDGGRSSALGTSDTRARWLGSSWCQRAKALRSPLIPVSSSHPRTERRGRHLNRHSWQKKSAAECAVFLLTGGVHNAQKANITPGRTPARQVPPCH